MTLAVTCDGWGVQYDWIALFLWALFEVVLLGSFPMTLRFLSFERNQTSVFSIRIPSTNIDFIQTKFKV